MKDIQNQPDYRRINIKKVGVKHIAYPITLLDKAKKVQPTVATVNMYVNLPHHFKGTHMSRFIEILNRFHGKIDLKSFRLILEEMKVKLQAAAAHMEIEFPYFLKRTGGTEAVGMAAYDCKMHGSLEESDDLVLEVKVPISPTLAQPAQDLLPRSLGKWGVAEVSLRFRHFIWLEDIITQVEEVIARHLAALVESNQPLEVESLTKALGRTLRDHQEIRWFALTVKNLASGFNTFASLEWPEAA